MVCCRYLLSRPAQQTLIKIYSNMKKEEAPAVISVRVIPVNAPQCEPTRSRSGSIKETVKWVLYCMYMGYCVSLLQPSENKETLGLWVFAGFESFVAASMVLGAIDARIRNDSAIMAVFLIAALCKRTHLL
eukprot:TRINITY_DN40947_c0_g1_i1.p1 TRINITY_DN40947_c0_g1~~TRINITY_DN40947_c0_g1_i1.p1  ORF type:complete len:131 (+),score=23.51 TRINITY_DN40947_c0_g1_i1:52-444(+)